MGSLTMTCFGFGRSLGSLNTATPVSLRRSVDIHPGRFFNQPGLFEWGV